MGLLCGLVALLFVDRIGMHAGAGRTLGVTLSSINAAVYAVLAVAFVVTPWRRS